MNKWLFIILTDAPAARSNDWNPPMLIVNDKLFCTVICVALAKCVTVININNSVAFMMEKYVIRKWKPAVLDVTLLK